MIYESENKPPFDDTFVRGVDKIVDGLYNKTIVNKLMFCHLLHLLWNSELRSSVYLDRLVKLPISKIYTRTCPKEVIVLSSSPDSI